MNEDTGYVVYLVAMLVLVVGALAGRGLSLGKGVRMALAWAAIFAVGFVLFGLRDEASDFFRDQLSENAVVQGKTVRIPRSEDGHFYADVRINGHPARLLIDSGATTTTLSRRTAADAGIAATGAFPVMVSTANGTMEVRRGRAKSVALGPIRMDELPVHIAPNDELDVIGMNFLERLARWSVEGRTLILELS